MLSNSLLVVFLILLYLHVFLFYINTTIIYCTELQSMWYLLLELPITSSVAPNLCRVMIDVMTVVLFAK